MQTTPQITGVIAQEELEAYKATAKIQDDCIVKRAYADFRSQHPNYTLVHHHSVTPIISRLARRVWIAVGQTMLF
ncbi:hypothetical protein I3271_09270 [Photobacterium leiognathi]|uniref:hypothetical protein n=1 Tax=Photobacterium leiognathi TaxID=553611 RepID=UPI001EDFD692|nr:hypothetical protein [Photobacterium leiognathi]MCG3884878.1 hypothetical protein [Photobacterium leiognathi]